MHAANPAAAIEHATPTSAWQPMEKEVEAKDFRSRRRHTSYTVRVLALLLETLDKQKFYYLQLLK